MSATIIPLRKGPPPAGVKSGLEILSRASQFPACQTSSSVFPTFNVKNATNEWRLNPSYQTSAFYEAPKSLDQQLGTKNINTLGMGYDTFPREKTFSESKLAPQFYENLDNARVHDSLQMYYFRPHPCQYPVKPTYLNFVSFK